MEKTLLKTLLKMLAHAKRKRKKYFGKSEGIYAYYDTQVKTLEDILMRVEKRRRVQ